MNQVAVTARTEVCRMLPVHPHIHCKHYVKTLETIDSLKVSAISLLGNDQPVIS